MLQKLIIFFILCVSIIFGKTYDVCVDTSKKYLKANEIAFFETTSFPSLMKIVDCNFNFSVSQNSNNSQSMEKFNIFIAYSFIYSLQDYYNYQVFYHTYTNSFDNDISYLLYKAMHVLYLFPVAVKGLIIYDTWNEGCPMESISRDNPYLFEDEKQIFYIQSSFHENVKRKSKCQWNFIAPSGYGFKIIVTQFSTLSSLFITNTTDIIVNHRSLVLNNPYYNSDKYLKINLSESNFTLVKNMELRASISIIKLYAKKFEGNCIQRAVSHGVEEWFLNFENYWDYPEYGYDINTYCKYEFSIPENTAIMVTVPQLCIEHNVDTIKYYFDENNSRILTNSTLVLGPYNYKKQIKWEFESDGNTAGIGFLIQFSAIDCTCPNTILSCADRKFQHKSKSSFVCNLIICKIAITNCDEDLSLITIQESRNTYVKFVSNNYTVFETSTEVTDAFLQNVHVFMNSNNDNYFEFRAINSNGIADLELKISPFEKPEVDLYITLTKKNPVYILDTVYASFIVVNVSRDLNLTIDLWCNLANGLPVYNNESLTKSLKSATCFENSNTYKCESKSRELAIYREEEPFGDFLDFPFFIIQLSDSRKGCLMKENTFFIPPYTSEKYISAISTSEECVIYILAQYDDNNGSDDDDDDDDDDDNDKYSYTYISHLWTTAKHETVKVFVGINLNILFFEYNSKTAENWQNIILLSYVYKIIIPPKAAIHLRFDTFLPYEENLYLNYPRKSIFATECMGTSKKHTVGPWQYLFKYKINEGSARFTVIYYNLLPTDTFYFFTDENDVQEIYITKTGDVLYFTNQTVYVQYSVDYVNTNQKLNSGAVLLIELVDDENNEIVL